MSSYAHSSSATVGADISRAELRRMKPALVEFLAEQRFDFHIVAELSPSAPRSVLEDAIYGWVARVNRRFLGRGWSAPHRRHQRMRGVAFFETNGGYHHAHMLVGPPAGASLLRFEMCARYFFQAHPCEELRLWYPRPVAPRGGIMHVRRIRPTHADRVRVAGYAAKTTEWSVAATENWKLLEDLSPRQAAS